MKGEQRTRKNIQNTNRMEKDQLSNLPEYIIYLILSLMDTKYAVQTCVLSKRWKHHWTNITSLNLDRKTIPKRSVFNKFVIHVLQLRKPFNLHRLGFHCRGKRNLSLENMIFDYARSHSLKELETDLPTLPPSLCFNKCETLTMLKLGSRRIHEGVLRSSCFGSLISVQLSEVQLSCFKVPGHDFNLLFTSLLNMENLFLIGCRVATNGADKLTMIAPRLVNLVVADFKHDVETMTLVICAPKLKLLDFNGMYPMVLVTGNDPIDKVNIHISTPINWDKDDLYTNDYKRRYASRLIGMAQMLSNAKSFTLWLTFPKRKFVFRHNAEDAENKAIEHNKDIWKKLWKELLLGIVGHSRRFEKVADLINKYIEKSKSVIEC